MAASREDKPRAAMSTPDAKHRPSRPRMEPASIVRRIKLAPHDMRDAVTPTDDVLVLAHLGVPRIDPADWSLTIDGLVGRSRTLGYDDLRSLPRTVVETVHQCCGYPQKPTVPTRRITNVRWAGVDLAQLLNELGVALEARYLWSYGLDHGELAGRHCDNYLKDMPLERLAAGGVLIAYEMNGAPLSAEHGFPARLVVPGYYGTNSVKWLSRLHLAEHRAAGLFTTELYDDDASPEDIAAGLPARRPVWAIAPEAVIVAPAPDAEVPVGQPVEIWGWAWSFHGIATVEVSMDDGASFARAALEPRRDWAWQRYALPWRPAVRGEVSISARAIEENGRGQPFDGARNAVHSVRVAVR